MAESSSMRMIRIRRRAEDMTGKGSKKVAMIEPMGATL